MKYIETYNVFSHMNEENRFKRGIASTKNKIRNIKIKDLFTKGRDFSKKVWSAARNESQETAQAFKILKRMMRGDEVSDTEKKFLKEQGKDIARVLPLIAIQGIPVPVPITPFLIAIGKKYGFSILPGDQEELKNQIEKEKKLMEEELNESISFEDFEEF